jgi:hypothetical protein
MVDFKWFVEGGPRSIPTLASSKIIGFLEENSVKTGELQQRDYSVTT